MQVRLRANVQKEATSWTAEVFYRHSKSMFELYAYILSTHLQIKILWRWKQTKGRGEEMGGEGRGRVKKRGGRNAHGRVHMDKRGRFLRSRSRGRGCRQGGDGAGRGRVGGEQGGRETQGGGRQFKVILQRGGGGGGEGGERLRA